MLPSRFCQKGIIFSSSTSPFFFFFFFFYVYEQFLKGIVYTLAVKKHTGTGSSSPKRARCSGVVGSSSSLYKRTWNMKCVMNSESDCGLWLDRFYLVLWWSSCFTRRLISSSWHPLQLLKPKNESFLVSPVPIALRRVLASGKERGRSSS